MINAHLSFKTIHPENPKTINMRASKTAGCIDVWVDDSTTFLTLKYKDLSEAMEYIYDFVAHEKK